MDLKGFQYRGLIQPGPTCIIASMHPMIGENVMKVEALTDEFVTLHKTGDHLALLDAIVEKGNLDESFQIKDTNVNSNAKNQNGSSKDDDSMDESKSRKTLKKNSSNEKQKTNAKGKRKSNNVNTSKGKGEQTKRSKKK